MKLQFKHNPAWRRNVAVGDRRRWILWAVALKIEIRAIPIWTFEIFWKRVLLGAAVLTLGGYLAAVTALHFWLARQPQNQVGWLDVALAPVRWEVLRQKRGDTAIAQAIAQLQQRNYGEAFHNLRVGLARSPGHVRGRILLAQFYAGNDPALALRTMEAGLPHSAHQPEFLRALFSIYTQFQARARADAEADRLLAADRTPPLPSLARSIIQALQAGLVLDRDPAKAGRLLAAVSPSGDAEEDARIARLHSAALVRLGRPDEARRILERTRSVSTGVDQCRAEAELAVALGDAAELESVLRRLKLVPDVETPQAYLVAFNSWHRLKRLTLRDAVEQEFYATFGGRDAALQLFAANAVNQGLPEVVHRAQTVAQANGLSTFAFRVHLTELALRRGEFDAAFRLLREWERMIETLQPLQRAYPELIERLTRVAVAGEDNQLNGLLTHLGNMRGRATPSTYTLVFDVLERSGNLAAAQQALQFAVRLYPHTDGLEARQQRYAATAITLPAFAASAPAGNVIGLPVTAEEAFAALDAALRDQSFIAARELLRTIRSVRPAWLAESEAGLSRREVQLALLTQDPFAARMVVRSYLEKFRRDEDVLPLVDMARPLLAQEMPVQARLIHDETVALRGDSAAVLEALASLDLKDDLAADATTAESALAALDRHLMARRPEEALRLLDYLRQKNPEWLPEARNQLGMREVRMRLALDQRPLALTALKDLTIRGGVARAAAFRLVRDYIAAGETERALLLAREIRKLLPGDPAVEKLVLEAEASRPVGSTPDGE